MEIKEIITIVGMLVTIGVSGFALYKAFKATPKELKTLDADLSTKYQELADRSLSRANKAEAKIKEMENAVEIYEKTLRELEDSIENHEEEIKELKKKISEQEEELAILRKKVLYQDVELLELKKIIQGNKNEKRSHTPGNKTIS